MPESKPFHEQHTKRESYYFKVSVFAIWTSLCKQWDLPLPWVNQMFRGKKKQPTTNPPHTEELWQRRDSSTKLTVGFLSLVEQVHLPPFYFFQLICTIQVERCKPVFHSQVLIAKALNARLYLLSCPSPLSYTNRPCYIKMKMLDVVDHSFLTCFLNPGQGPSGTVKHCLDTAGQSIKQYRLLRWQKQTENQAIKMLLFLPILLSVPDKACSHPTSEHGLKWARFQLWLAQKG